MLVSVFVVRNHFVIITSSMSRPYSGSSNTVWSKSLLFSCKIHHLLEYALYIYSSTWKLVVPTTVWSVPLIEAPKHASKRGFYLLHLFLPFFINFFTAATNRTIISCFQSVNMKILLVKKKYFQLLVHYPSL